MELRFMTPTEVWEGYNPHLAPLESTITSVDVEGNLLCAKQYFTADETPQGKIRAYCEIYSDQRWADSRAAIMLLPSFRRVDSKQLIRTLVSEGYVVGIVDYCGAVSECEDKTTFPADLTFAKHPECIKGLNHLEQDARHTAWFVWSKIVRRAINLLQFQTIVDSSRICLLGIGEGAHIAWQVAGIDKRVGALITVGESGYRWSVGKSRYKFGNVPVTDEERAFSAGVGAETYAKFVSCPTFILASRTGNYADVDRMGDIYSIVNTYQKQLLITHGRETQITVTALDVLLKWLRNNFVLDTATNVYYPDVNAEEVGGDLYITVNAGANTQFTRVYVCYGEIESNARHWDLLEDIQKVDVHSYAVRVPVYDKDELIVAYATCAYDDGLICSSPVHAIVPSKMGITNTEERRESSRVIYDGTMGLGSFECRTEETILPDDILRQAVGPYDIKGITAQKGNLYLCRDAVEFAKLRRSSTLHFDAYSPKERELEVIMYSYPDMKKYTAYTTLTGGEYWQKILLQSSDFKSEEGRMLSKFSDSKILIIEDVSGVIFNNFLWI